MHASILIPLLLLMAARAAVPRRMVMPWACLEVCDSETKIAAYLNQLKVNASYFTDLSTERYILNGTGAFDTLSLKTNGTAVAESLGLGANPMIISADIKRLRTLFHNPQPFIDAAAAEAKTHSFASYQIDFEPDSGALNNDSAAYVGFLIDFANALKPTNTDLLIAFDEWSPIWNLTLLKIVNTATTNTYWAQVRSRYALSHC